MTANSGIIPAITTEDDLIVSDELNHASIIDGVRLSKASRAVFPHRDVDGLEKVLREARAGAERHVPRTSWSSPTASSRWTATSRRCAGICEVAERYEAAVMVDDAHASGVLGRNGRGTVDHFDLHGRVDIQVGTLSKAIGVMGGYIAGRQHLKDYLIQRCRTLLFSTSQPPAVAAACIAAIDVLENEPERIERLWDNTRFFKAGLQQLGFDTGISETPITPVMAGARPRPPSSWLPAYSSAVSSPRPSSIQRCRWARRACARSLPASTRTTTSRPASTLSRRWGASCG